MSEKESTNKAWHDYLVNCMKWTGETPDNIVSAIPCEWNPEDKDIVFLSLDDDDNVDIPGCYRYVYTDRYCYFIVNRWFVEKGETVEDWVIWWIPTPPKEGDEAWLTRTPPEYLKT